MSWGWIATLGVPVAIHLIAAGVGRRQHVPDVDLFVGPSVNRMRAIALSEPLLLALRILLLIALLTLIGLEGCQRSDPTVNPEQPAEVNNASPAAEYFNWPYAVPAGSDGAADEAAVSQGRTVLWAAAEGADDPEWLNGLADAFVRLEAAGWWRFQQADDVANAEILVDPAGQAPHGPSAVLRISKGTQNSVPADERATVDLSGSIPNIAWVGPDDPSALTNSEIVALDSVLAAYYWPIKSEPVTADAGPTPWAKLLILLIALLFVADLWVARRG